MPTDIKSRPDVSMTSPAAVGSSLDAMKKAVEQVQTAKGSVSVAKLKQAIEKVDTKGATKVMRAIEDKFSKEVTRYVSTCGGRRRRVTEKEVPTELTKTEVKTVLDALVEAKKRAKGLDANKDGQITMDEYHGAKPYRGELADKLAGAVAYDRIEEYKYLMEKWNDRLWESHGTIEARQAIDKDIQSVCDYHAKTKGGAEALSWAFRDLATRGNKLTRSDVDSALTRAETHDRTRLVRMMTNTWAKGAKEKGHLSTTEIKELLETSNLAQYSRDIKKAITKRVGGDYVNFYLAGKDLLGVDTPDYKDLTKVDTHKTTC